MQRAEPGTGLACAGERKDICWRSTGRNGDKYFSIVVDKNTDFEYMYDEMMNDGYLYNWLTKANEINGYSPKLAESCYVYRKDELGVLTVELEYVD